MKASPTKKASTLCPRINAHRSHRCIVAGSAQLRQIRLRKRLIFTLQGFRESYVFEQTLSPQFIK